MSKEKIDTTNKFILPPNEDAGSDEARKQIIENLQKITPEQARAVGTELEQKMKEMAQRKKEREAPQSLLDFRQAWKERIKGLSHDFQNNLNDILKKLDKIPVKVNIDKDDGSRLIEFKLGDKTRKILDPKLCTHTNIIYCNNWEDKNKVKLGGMRGDFIGLWGNEKLAYYVGQKQKEGLSIPKFEDVKILLEELGSIANLDEEGDQIAMLMYLTGLNGCYRLAMKNNIARLRIFCGFEAHYHCDGVDEHEHNNLLMMHYE